MGMQRTAGARSQGSRGRMDRGFSPLRRATRGSLLALVVVGMASLGVTAEESSASGTAKTATAQPAQPADPTSTSRYAPSQEAPAAANGAAGSLRIVTWNVLRGSVEQVQARKDQFIAAGKRLRADVIAVQEVTSFAAVQRLAEFMGFSSPHIAVSNTRKDTNVWFEALELAVISRVPIVGAQTLQAKPSRFGAVLITPSATVDYFSNARTRSVLPPPDVMANPADISGERGVLRVELANGLVLYNVHLKSNYPEYCRDLDDRLRAARQLRERIAEEARDPTPLEAIDLAAADRIAANLGALKGPDDPTASTFLLEYARLRETVMAGVAVAALQDLEDGLVPVVLGDFNTSDEEPCKSGRDLNEDTRPRLACGSKIIPDTCGETDGFDDTHGLLHAGIVRGLRMVALSRGIGRTQWGRDWRTFPEVPIDHIYVPLEARSAFSLVERIVGTQEGQRVFGSDHAPLITQWSPGVNAATDPGAAPADGAPSDKSQPESSGQ